MSQKNELHGVPLIAINGLWALPGLALVDLEIRKAFKAIENSFYYEPAYDAWFLYPSVIPLPQPQEQSHG
jgi:hypothetical protein